MRLLSLIAVALFALVLAAPARACDYGVPASALQFAPAGYAGCGVPQSAPMVLQAPAYGYVQQAPVLVQRQVIRQRAVVPVGYGVGGVGAVPVGAGGINVNVGNGNQSQRRGLLPGAGLFRR
jgi:hypothetical protein